ncbi:MAG TPA: MBL fold metallo-hydrolase [Gemmatimonadaceae bacterium]|nr:MBL fold metallo-hydrolase [Gemmatimonadaceae bacterium]
MTTSLPPHHDPSGGFRNPWPNAEPKGLASLLRWVLGERLLKPRPADPPASAFARVRPAFATPRAGAGSVGATWVGHSSFVLQLGGLNVLTDPMWGERASPLAVAGPKRRVPPAVDFDALPPVDVVVLSHDHYDHLDDATVRRLAARYPDARWLAPLGVGAWLAGRGVRAVEEHDWWGSTMLRPARAAGGEAHGHLLITCVPAQHFSGRSMVGRNRTLWCGWVLRAGARAVYFAGDTGRHPEFAEVARRCGPFDLALMPIGAYEPRWFMRAVHMNPEDAVAAYQEIARAHPDAPPPVMGGMHWGTFKLTDEPMDEPPKRTRQLWELAGLPAEKLWLPRHGETREI